MLHIVVRDKETYKSYTERESMYFADEKRKLRDWLWLLCFRFRKELGRPGASTIISYFSSAQKEKKKQLFFSVLPPWPLWLRHCPVHLILHCTTANRITKEIRTILNPTFGKKKKNLTCTLSLVICVCLTEKKTLVDVCAASLEAHREIKKSIVNFFFKYFVVLLLLLTSFCPTGVFSTGREAFLAPTHLSRKKKKIFATRIKVSLFLPPVGTFFLEVNKSGK